MKRIYKLIIVFMIMFFFYLIFSTKTYATISGYTVEENYIRDIQPNTTYEAFIKNIYSDEKYTITENGKNISGTDLIKTGQVLKEENKNYTLVVIGDITGDGKVNVRDMMTINKYRLKREELTGAYLIAGDVNYDSNINIKDMIQINKYRLGKKQVLGKQVIKAPMNIEVSTAGIVTWTNSSNATGYEISIDNKTWTNATSGVDYLNMITKETGTITIYVRAVNSNTDNYISPSSVARKDLTVNTVTIKSNNSEGGTISKESYNVINGATYTTNKNTLILKGKTTGINTKDLITITATANLNFEFNSWSNVSGTISENTIITATFVGKVFTIALANNSDTSAIYLRYKDGYYLDSTCTKKMTTTENPITLPTKKGYTFQGYGITYNDKEQDMIKIEIISANGYLNDSPRYDVMDYISENITAEVQWQKIVIVGPSSVTIVAGNTETVELSGTNIGKISIKTASSNTIATTTINENKLIIKGVSPGTTGVTIEESNGEQLTISIKVLVACYEVSSVTNSEKKYQSSLKNAYDIANSGATIKVLQNITDTSTLSISKNLTIDTNNKTITKSSGTITITAGTTIIKGSGSVICSNVIDAIIVTNSATLKTEGTPLIKSTGNVITGTESSKVNLTGGYIWSTRGDYSTNEIFGIQMKKSSTLTITNTNVYNSAQSRSAIKFVPGSTGTCTISGTSKIGNSPVAEGIESTGSCISYFSTGKLTLKNTATIYSGPYSLQGIVLRGKMFSRIFRFV